jgi:tRNA(Ile)-lysidine synthase
MTRSLDDAMQDFNPALPLAVGFSGGADSTALLVAAAAKWPGKVIAVHVNHGLQAAASGFENQCQAVCQQLSIPLIIERVNAHPGKGESPEDAARRARYKAFSALARAEHAQLAIKSIAIAQHADDQVETVLLALSRGSGLAGLSGMPSHWVRHGLDFYRPLLSVNSADIRAWLHHKGQTFVDDPSNLNEQFTRNRIRGRLLPVLHTAFPQFRDTFARSARHAAQAQELLDEVAAVDLNAVGGPERNTPRLKSLQQLSVARQANVLRYWLKSSHQVIPSTAQMDELLHQVAACTTRGHRIQIKVGSGVVQREGKELTWYNRPV